MKIGKKGQITIFIIIGLIILISSGFFFYFKSVLTKEIEISKPEIAPARFFIEDCIRQVTRDGLEILGLNGGYITFPNRISHNPKLYLTAGPSNFKNPYWDLNAIPTIKEMENQLSSHINRNLRDCFNGFQELKEEFDIMERGNVLAKATIGEKDISVDVKYPITIISKLNETRISFDRHHAKLKIRLKKLYEFAKLIMERENKDAFIEQKTIDLIAMYDEEKIPTTDVVVSCSKKKWLLPEIERTLKRLLAVNLPFIKIAGTNYNKNSYIPNPFSSDETFKNSYFNYHYIWDLGKADFDDLKVAFTYETRWPLNIYARPSNNGILTSNSQRGQQAMSFFCLHIWHFTYDLSFPVKISIIDQRAPDHEDFLFNFAFRANIDHNQPARIKFARNVFKGQDIRLSNEYCSDTYFLTDLYTDDKVTGYALVGANLTFTCGVFRCELNSSEILSSGGDVAGISKEMPYCVNAVLRGEAKGYEPAEKFIQTNKEGNAYTLSLTPIKYVNKYSVVKHPSNELSVEKSLESGEKATIILTNKENNFESYGAYLYESIPLKLLAKDDFTYNLNIYLIKNETIVGGYNANWTANWHELENSDEIKFHVVEQKPEPSSDNERYLFVAALSSYKTPEPEIK